MPRRVRAGGGGEEGERALLGGRGAALRVDGDREVEPSPTGLSFGTPPGNKPPVGETEPDGLPAALPLVPAPFGLFRQWVELCCAAVVFLCCCSSSPGAPCCLS